MNGRNQFHGWCIKNIPKKFSLDHCEGNWKLNLFELLHNTLGKLKKSYVSKSLAHNYAKVFLFSRPSNTIQSTQTYVTSYTRKNKQA